MQILRVELNIPLRRGEIRFLRGLVAERAGWKADLFHNHRDGLPDKYHFRYPLIQYQCRKGKAMVIGINEGAVALRALIDPAAMTFCGDIPVSQWIETNKPITLAERPRHYRLTQWLALNAGNYRHWDQLRHDPEAQLAELNRILAAHLLAFCRSMGFEAPRPKGLKVLIDQWDAPRQALCHQAKLLSFDVRFRCNIELPNDIGIGKSASHGFGILSENHYFSAAENRFNHSKRELEFI